MKHIRKIFESKSDLEKDVRDIFHDYIFDDEPDSDVEYSGECWSNEDGEDKPHVGVLIYGPQKKHMNVTDVGEFDSFISETQKQIDFLKKMRSLCYRLKSWDYQFDFDFNEKENEYYIKVYESSTDFDLSDVFYTRKYGVNEHSLKRVLKSEYNLELMRTEFLPASGRERNYSVFTLKTPIDRDHQIFKDLSSLTKKNVTGPYNKLFRDVVPHHPAEGGKWWSIKLVYE